MFAEDIELLIIKGRKHYLRTIKAIHDSSMVDYTKASCNDVILDLDEERAFRNFNQLGSHEKLEFSILLNELYGKI